MNVTKKLLEVERLITLCPRNEPLLLTSTWCLNPRPGFCKWFSNSSPYFHSYPLWSLFITAAREVLLKPESGYVPHQNPPEIPHLAQKKSKVLTMAYKTLMICRYLPPHTHTLTHTHLWPHLALLSPSVNSSHPGLLAAPWTIPSTFPSQGLCLPYSVCLEHSSPRDPLSLIPQPSLSLRSNVTLSTRPIPSSLFKIATCCSPCTLLTPLLMFSFP